MSADIITAEMLSYAEIVCVPEAVGAVEVLLVHEEDDNAESEERGGEK